MFVTAWKRIGFLSAMPWCYDGLREGGVAIKSMFIFYFINIIITSLFILLSLYFLFYSILFICIFVGLDQLELDHAVICFWIR